MGRGIVRVYISPSNMGKYVEVRDGHQVSGRFFDLEYENSVRIHVPDFCMAINIDTSGVHIAHHPSELLARE